MQTAGRICGTSLVTVSVLSFIIGCIISVFSKQLLVFLNAEPEVLILGTGYLRLMGIFLIFTMLMSIFNNFLICNCYSSCVFISGIVCNVLNVVFGYMVLYSGIKLPIHPVTALAVFVKTVLGISVKVLSLHGSNPNTHDGFFGYNRFCIARYKAKAKSHCQQKRKNLPHIYNSQKLQFFLFIF